MNIQSRSERENSVAGWERRLSAANYRVTEPRRQILRAMVSRQGPVTAETLSQELRPAGIGRATVFRTIDMLAELGVVHRLHVGGCHAYTVCPPVHHHHLTCSSCGRVESVEGCGLDEQLERVGMQTGFTIEDHHLELTGRCARCQ